jgi:hypothetical protein
LCWCLSGRGIARSFGGWKLKCSWGDAWRVSLV